MNKKVLYEDLGSMEYKEAWDYQEERFNDIIEKKIRMRDEGIQIKTDNYLLFVEHPHVYTLGKSGDEQNMLINAIQLQAKDATFHKTNRGGDITYHGPGQIVGYPILDLENFDIKGVKDYIYLLEESIIRFCAEFSLKADRMDKATGVWLDIGIPGKERKICAIGVKASRFTTMHGFALNINTSLEYFNFINPCGFVDKGVTSLAKELGAPQDMEAMRSLLKEKIIEVFRMEV